MRPMPWPRTLMVSLALSMGFAGSASGQATGSSTASPLPSASTAQATTVPADPGQAPEVRPNLDRIRQAISRDPTIKLEDYRLRFYVEIVAKWPTFQEYVGKSDLRNGPTPYGGMTHQDFLNHVTPRNLYGSAVIKAHELLQFSIVNWLGQSLAKKAIESFRNARDESELRAIRARIEQELAALRGKEK
jgi:hypothetical protein